MIKRNRRAVLKEICSVSSISLVGAGSIGNAAARSSSKSSNRNRAKAKQVLKIVNRDDLSDEQKKKQLARFDDALVEATLQGHNTEVTTGQMETGSDSGISVAAVDEQIYTTVTNKNAWGDKLWRFTLETGWGYTGLDITYVNWGTATDTWNSWSVDSTSVTDSTEENYDGGLALGRSMETPNSKVSSTPTRRAKLPM